MSKLTTPQQTTVFRGIDVNAATLAVAMTEQGQPLQQRQFANRASDHKALIGWLGKGRAGVRVSSLLSG